MDFVQSKIEQFDQENEAVEQGLTQLIARFPDNNDLAHVLLKVAAINSLYNTQIWDVLTVARRIQSCRIDPLLENGRWEAVIWIAKIDNKEGTRWNYSFATKYCSWHKQELYPIYDSRVDFCLRSYCLMSHFADFTQQTLWNYEKFREIVEAFRMHYGLQSLSFKETDKFLFQLGSQYFNASDAASGPTGGDARAPSVATIGEHIGPD
jgi:hypothetical protein